jgi:hypothetical protein
MIGLAPTAHRFWHGLGFLLVVAAVGASTPSGVTMVVCAPGYPGSTDEAQAAMDGLAVAVASAAGWSRNELSAVYFETEAGGVERLAQPDAAVALVTLPFFLEHRRELELDPRAYAVPAGRSAVEAWSLVAGAGKIEAPADLDGWQLVSLAGHSPRFVRGPALGGWGELPGTLSITFSGAVLSALRKAARGETVALLLDAHQADALERLPFADQLEVVHRSEPLPVSVLCTVGDRLPPDRVDELMAAVVSLDHRPDAAQDLAGVRVDRFVVADDVLGRAVDAFEEARE